MGETVRSMDFRAGGAATSARMPGMLPGFAAGIMARRAEKQFRKDFERLKRVLET